MRVSDLKTALSGLPDDATINAIFNRSADGEFSIGCVSYHPKMKIVMLANDASECSHVERVVYDEDES